MTDTYARYESEAIRALRSPDATTETDHLAQLLLEAAAIGRQQTAVNHVTAGELAKLRGEHEATKLRGKQSDANVLVQQAVNVRETRRTTNAENRAAKAIAGRDRAVENLRPAYHALKAIAVHADDVRVSNKHLGRHVRAAIASDVL